MQNPTPHQADIIAFPARAAAIPTPDPGQARLALALAGLVQALEEQRAAVATWRASLAELRQSVETLGINLAGYRNNLSGLALGVDHLNQQARTLARITVAS